jgi:hypothetical protein
MYKALKKCPTLYFYNFYFSRLYNSSNSLDIKSYKLTQSNYVKTLKLKKKVAPINLIVVNKENNIPDMLHNLID